MREHRKEKKQQLKKYAVFTLMGLAFAGCLWMIFAPSAHERERQGQDSGFNDRIPDAAGHDLIGDKRGAYQQESMRRRQEGAMVSLDQFSSLLAGDESASAQGGDDKEQAPVTERMPIAGAAASYRDIGRTLETFYESPATDEREQEILALEWRLQEMERKLEEKESRSRVMDEQAALMERSYALAARYMGPDRGGDPAAYPQVAADSGGDGNKEAQSMAVRPTAGSTANGKVKVSPFGRRYDGTVSALEQEYSAGELSGLYGEERNAGFYTLKDAEQETGRNTIQACIHGDQTVMSGQSVFIRLLEPARVEECVIPAHTVLTASAVLQGERLALEITSIAYRGMIYPVKVSVYDTDGTKGVYVPASMELDALKEVAVGMGSAVGNSYTITQNAGAQIASDLTKGVMQGASQYFAKKIRMVKVNLKAGHKLLLLPQQQ